MRFIILPSAPADDATEDTVALVPDSWDDYGFRTQFSVYVAHNSSTYIWIGETKVLALNYPSDSEYRRTADIIPQDGSNLDPALFCSLGQDSSFYRRLGGFSEDLGIKILNGLNDICFSKEQPQWWVQHEGFGTSLLRLNSANLARIDARALFEGKKTERDVRHQIRFHRSDGGRQGGPEIFEASFDGSLEVPGRLNVIVGKNGAGKTALLAGIASWFSRVEPRSSNKFTYTPDFSRVVVVTLNPFDSEYRPSYSSQENVRFVGRQPISLQAVRHIRSATGMDNNTASDEWAAALLKAFPNPDSLRAITNSAIADDEIIERLKKLRSDSSWQELIAGAFEDDAFKSELCDNPETAVSCMSAGQRSLTSLYTALYLHLDNQALVLLDEPENYLHPSLIARFTRTLNAMLDQRRAYAIVATHSPVIVQETPSKFVTILDRIGDTTTPRSPDFETFGESIDNITQHLFDTDFHASHWKNVLRRFAESGITVDEVARKISNKPLSLLARTYFAYYRNQGSSS